MSVEMLGAQSRLQPGDLLGGFVHQGRAGSAIPEQRFQDTLRSHEPGA
jgi:hypothetical protein